MNGKVDLSDLLIEAVEIRPTKAVSKEDNNA